MDRRTFLKAAAASGLTPLAGSAASAAAAAEPPFVRVRPGDAAWPPQARWNDLFNDVGGRLVKLDDPLAACRAVSDGAACQAFLKEMKNPYFLKHALRLSWEVLPLHKLRLPWKKSRVNLQHKIYSRCPEAATWDYVRRKDADKRAAVDVG